MRRGRCWLPTLWFWASALLVFKASCSILVPVINVKLKLYLVGDMDRANITLLQCSSNRLLTIHVLLLQTFPFRRMYVVICGTESYIIRFNHFTLCAFYYGMLYQNGQLCCCWKFKVFSHCTKPITAIIKFSVVISFILLTFSVADARWTVNILS